MIAIRRARPMDAAAIGAVHVATWRSTYAGVLPDAYLASLSSVRHAAGYEQAITDRRDCHAVFVAVASGPDAPPGCPDGAARWSASPVAGGRAGLGSARARSRPSTCWTTTATAASGGG